MSLAKMLQKKPEDSGRTGKVQQPKTPKKSDSQAAKSKKADGIKKTPKRTDESRTAWWEQFRQYLREVSYELKKVVWPSRKETIGSTSIVLVLVILSGIYLGVVDLVLSRLIRVLLG